MNKLSGSVMGEICVPQLNQINATKNLEHIYGVYISKTGSNDYNLLCYGICLFFFGKKIKGN